MDLEIQIIIVDVQTVANLFEAMQTLCTRRGWSICPTEILSCGGT